MLILNKLINLIMNLILIRYEIYSEKKLIYELLLSLGRSFTLSTIAFTCVTYCAGALMWWGPNFAFVGNYSFDCHLYFLIK